MKLSDLAKYIYAIIGNVIRSRSLYYIIETANWSIKHDGLSIASNLNQIRATTTITHLGIFNSIIHYEISRFLKNFCPDYRRFDAG